MKIFSFEKFELDEEDSYTLQPVLNVVDSEFATFLRSSRISIKDNNYTIHTVQSKYNTRLGNLTNPPYRQTFRYRFVHMDNINMSRDNIPVVELLNLIKYIYELLEQINLRANVFRKELYSKLQLVLSNITEESIKLTVGDPTLNFDSLLRDLDYFIEIFNKMSKHLEIELNKVIYYDPRDIANLNILELISNELRDNVEYYLYDACRNINSIYVSHTVEEILNA